MINATINSSFINKHNIVIAGSLLWCKRNKTLVDLLILETNAFWDERTIKIKS